MQATSLSRLLGCSALICAFTGSWQQPQTVTVRGVVYDSLSRKPVPGATIWISGGEQIATADRDGRFELRGVGRGQRFVEFSSPVFDSLELGTLGTPLNIGEHSNPTLTLSTPSFATVWRALCKEHPLVGSDIGIVWGTIRDAESDTRLHGARATFTWTEPQVDAGKKIEIKERSFEARTDSVGNYYACGVPASSNLTVQAAGTRSLSGELQLTTSGFRLQRFDMRVSSDLLASTTTPDSVPDDSSHWVRPHGTSMVRGVVRDDKQRAVGDASILFVAIDSLVRSSADGSFSMEALPAGTHQVLVRKVGFTPATATLHLRPGSASELMLSISSVAELSAVNVKSEAFTSRDRLDFDYRRKTGFGHFLDAKAFENKYDLMSVLAQLPSMTVRSTSAGGVTITPTFTSWNSHCRGVAVWIDGLRSSMYEASYLPMHLYVAVEWYPRSGSAPPMYVGDACGVIMFWTKQSRWGEKK